MSDDVLENYVRQYIASQPGPEVSFAWQGGECSRAHWMMGVRADSTMAITLLTVALAVSVMAIVESARLGFSSVMAI
jgi:hypothetical protein